MKQTALLRCFLIEESFSGLKHLTEKMTAVPLLSHVWLMVDHTPPTKMKYLALFFDQFL